MQEQLLRGFFLGDVQVEPLKGRISDHGRSAQLSPEALDVLLHLASHPGEILSTRELIEKVWGSGHGSREAMYRAISELLRALNDDRDNPRFIEILPDQGYRLVAKVEDMQFPAGERGRAEGQSQEKERSFLESLWEELKQRRVVRVGIGYLIVAWLLLQVADVLIPALELPVWVMKLMTLLLAVGFVLSLIVSWLVQATPSGLVLHKSANRSGGSDWRHGVELLAILILMGGVTVLVYRQIWLAPPAPVPELVEGTTPGSPGKPRSAAGFPTYEQSIAVLPFVNMGSNPDDQYFGDGLAEELLHMLAEIKSLKVAARTSSFAFAGKGLDIPSIARQLQVVSVLEGSVRRDGDRVRVTAQLVDSEGFHLWSDTYDRQTEKILDVQSDIALSVAKRIMTSLSPEASAALADKPTENPEAYEIYLQGLRYLRQPRQAESLTEASARFERAIELDPRFARAYAGSCETELSWFRLNRDVAHFERAERQCNRALTLDSGQVEVYTALGNLYRSSSQFEDARSYFEQALELNPYHEEAVYGLARTMQGLGDLETAEQLLHQCIALEPGFWGPYLAMGNFLHHMGRYEEAVPFYMRVTELTPDNPDGFNNLGAALFDSGDWEGAESAWTISLDLAPSPMAYRNMGTVYYYQGKYEEAATMHGKAIELAPDDHWLWGKLAAAYEQVDGEEERSRAAFERAIELAEERLRVESEDAQTMAYLASYLVALGEGERARQTVSLATQLEPENPETWYFSGLVNARLGNREQAIEDLERALDLGYSGRLIAHDPAFTNLGDAGLLMGLAEQFTTN